MIADLTFPAGSGVRSARFVPRSRVPLDAACVVAAGIREALRAVIGACECTVGIPVVPLPALWRAFVSETTCFLAPGRLTDVLLAVPRADARALVRAAFGEPDDGRADPSSTLEAHALGVVATRCAAAFDVLAAERRAPVRALAADEVPPCVALFDVRVHTPVTIALAVALTRELPDSGATGSLSPATLDDVTVEVRAAFGEALIDAATVAAWRVGTVVRLDTQVGAQATLKVGPRRIAGGTCGVRGQRTAFLVTDNPTGAHA